MTVASSAILAQPAALADGEPLKGSVSDTGVLPTEEHSAPPTMEMPTPNLGPDDNTGGQYQKGKLGEDGGALEGNTRQDALNGSADDYGGDPLQGESPRAGAGGPLKGNARNNVLQGNASLDESGLSGEDPDMGDQQLMVEWDKWRNRFLWAVQSGVQEALNNPEHPSIRFDPVSGKVLMRFPMGTTAWFSAVITHDRRIKSLKIDKTSGFPGYDQAVLNAVRNLEGTSILKFPARSRRMVVGQTAGIKTATTGGRQFFHFGDVEHYQVQP